MSVDKPSPAQEENTMQSKIAELLHQYFELGVAEGREGRNHDTEAGDAQRVLSEIESALSTDAEPVEWQLVYADGNVSRAVYSKVEAESYMRSSVSVVSIRPLYAAPPAPAVAVEVKPLEWSNVDETWNDVWDCVTDLAEGYSITRWWLDDRRDEIGHFEVEELGEDQFGSLEEAQAAAQTHFTFRYAALSAQVQDVAGDRSAEIRKAGIKARDELLERLADDGSVDNDLADYMERIVDACVRAASPAAKQGEEEWRDITIFDDAEGRN